MSFFVADEVTEMRLNIEFQKVFDENFDQIVTLLIEIVHYHLDKPLETLQCKNEARQISIKVRKGGKNSCEKHVVRPHMLFSCFTCHSRQLYIEIFKFLAGAI